MTQGINIWAWPGAQTATAALLAGSCLFSTPAQAMALSDIDSRMQPDCAAEMNLQSIRSLSPASGPRQMSAASPRLKSATILGGIPSKFEQMKRQQSSMAAPATTMQSRIMAAPQLQAAVSLRFSTNYSAAPCLPRSGGAQTSKLTDIKEAIFPKGNGAYNKYSDDILGTAALPVHRTPLDRKWNHVSAAKTRSQTALRAYMAAAGINRHGSKRQLIHRVNSWVNAAITYTDDIRMTGTRDSWAPALQTLRSGRGDCEDYAIGKMQLLMAAGIREQDMHFVVVRDLVRRADHAILVVKLDGEMLLLDSNTNRIVDARQNHDYMPVFSFSGSKKWMHGRRYQPKTPSAPVQLASR